MEKNKHDLLFRKTFQCPKLSRAFCSAYLPDELQKKINFKKIRLRKLRLRKLSKSFIRTQQNENLKEEIADIVYSAELISGGEALFILHAEHQSTPDKFYPVRNALYALSAVKDYAENYQAESLPVPISFLYYHGRPTPSLCARHNGII